MEHRPDLRTEGPQGPEVQEPLQNNAGPHDLQVVPWENQQNMCNADFRHFKVDDRDPRQQLGSLKVLCENWLRPELRSKGHILDLLVLEQIELSGTPELKALVLENRLQTCCELEQLLTGQQQPQEQEAPQNWDTKDQVMEQQAEIMTQDFTEPEVQEPTQENTGFEDTQEIPCKIPAFLCRAWNICFRNFHVSNLDPWQQLNSLQMLCWNWLRPDLRSKEQILDLVVLEQFVLSSSPELQDLVLENGVQTCAELEQLLSTGEQSQQDQDPQNEESEEEVPGEHDRQRGDDREEIEQEAGLGGAAGGADPEDTVAMLPAGLSVEGVPHKRPRVSLHSRSSWGGAGPTGSEQESRQPDCSRLAPEGTFGAQKRTPGPARRRGDSTEKVEQKLRNMTGGAAGSEQPTDVTALQDTEDMLKVGVAVLTADAREDMEQAAGHGGAVCSEEVAVATAPLDTEDTLKAGVSAVRADGREELEPAAGLGGSAASDEAAGGAAPQDTMHAPMAMVSAKAGHHKRPRSSSSSSSRNSAAPSEAEQEPSPGSPNAQAAPGAGLRCPDCGKTFAYLSQYNLHRRWHTGERPFHCAQCQKGFRQQSDLRVHMRTHTGERPFRCHKCDAAFAHHSTLRGHLRVHSGARPYVCGVCASAFGHQSNLTAHMRTHSGLKPYTCAQCDRSFRQLSTCHRRLHGPPEGEQMPVPAHDHAEDRDG